MIYLVDTALCTEADFLQAQPQYWRMARRFNRPVQLATAAALQAAQSADDASACCLVALAACQGGSPELLRWVERVSSTPDLATLRTNPTWTLHGLDNLALSAVSIFLGNNAPCLGLGGAPGQAAVALEVALQQLGEEGQEEVLLFAGDQDDAASTAGACGAALLFSRRPRPYSGTGLTVRFESVARTSPSETATTLPHAARPLAWVIDQVRTRGIGSHHAVAVPAQWGDGYSAAELSWRAEP